MGVNSKLCIIEDRVLQDCALRGPPVIVKKISVIEECIPQKPEKIGFKVATSSAAIFGTKVHNALEQYNIDRTEPDEDDEVLCEMSDFDYTEDDSEACPEGTIDNDTWELEAEIRGESHCI